MLYRQNQMSHWMSAGESLAPEHEVKFRKFFQIFKLFNTTPSAAVPTKDDLLMLSL